MRANAILFLLFMIPIGLLASNFQGGESIEINEARNENQYLAGGTITINAPIRGDLVLAGGEVYIQDSIVEDAILTGGTLDITGVIGDDLRAAGGEVVIGSDVLGDVVLAGGELTIQSNVTIHGDLIIAGGECTIKGKVLGKTRLYGGELTWSGEATNGLEVRGGSLTLDGIVRGNSSIAVEHLTVSEGAAVYGELRYWQKSGELDFGQAVKTGSVIYDESLKEAWGDRGGFSFKSLWPIFTASGLLVIALLTIVLFPTFKDNEDFPEEQIGRRFLLGLAYFVGIPLLAILVMATIIGIPIGLFLIVFYLFSLAVMKSLSAVVIAFDLRARQDRDWSSGMMIVVGLIIFILLQIIGWIPIVGWVIIAAVALYAFGTLIQILGGRRNSVKMEEEFTL